MLSIVASVVFTEWLTSLRDRDGGKRIAARIDRLRLGNFGDAKSVGGGVAELRLDVGPGYRLYFARDGEVLVILLYGGDKSSQRRDIDRARLVLEDWRSGDARGFSAI